MNLSASARNISCILLAGPALFALKASIRGLIDGASKEPRLILVIAATIAITLSLAALGTAFLAFRRKDAGYLLPFWTFAAGAAAPFVPPTIRRAVMSCPPPAISCGVVGAASWPILIACFTGLALAYFAVASEHVSPKSTYAALTATAQRWKVISAALALVASALLIWLHYDLGARELKDAIDNAVAAERARAAGKFLVGDIVDGPSEALTIFMGLVITLTVGGASFRGSIRWLKFLWPFVLGLISFPLTGALDSIGSFGWAYRNFAEKYAWFALLGIFCLGFLTAQLASTNLWFFSRKE
jgi:hypothetical protein